MNQPWLTTSDWPVSALVLKPAKNSTVSATSSVVVNSPSTVCFSITFLITSSSLMPSSLVCSGSCLSTSSVRTKPGANHVCAHVVLGPFLGDNPAKPEQAVLGGDIGRFEHRRFFRVHRPHVDHAAGFGWIHVPHTGLGREKRAVLVVFSQSIK